MNQFDGLPRPKTSDGVLRKETVKIRVKFLSPAEIAQRAEEDRLAREAELKANQPKHPLFNRQEFDFLLMYAVTIIAIFFTGCACGMVRKSMHQHGNSGYANIVHTTFMAGVTILDALVLVLLVVTFHTARQSNARRNRLARFAR